MSDRFRRTLNSCTSEVHSDFIYHFFQKLYDFRLHRFTVESCYHCFSLIRIHMFLHVIFTSVLTFFVHVQDLSFHIHDSFIELIEFVSLLLSFFIRFLHFCDG